MMDTVLNLGLTINPCMRSVTTPAMRALAWDSYRAFIQMYGDVVMGWTTRFSRKFWRTRRRASVTNRTRSFPPSNGST